MKMIATKHFGYAGKDRRPGDELDVADSEARLLVKLGRAKRKTVEPPPAKAKAKPKPAEQTRDVQAEDDAGENNDAGDDAKPKKGRYRRRDMKADGDGE